MPNLSAAGLLLAGVATWPLAAQHVLSGYWPAQLDVRRAGEYRHAGAVYASSSSLLARWRPPAQPVALYVLVAVEKYGAVQAETDGNQTEFELDDLKAGTEYTIYLRACLDAECREYIEAEEAAAASTEEEYWRILGAGRSFQTALRVVADGNVAPYPLLYGPWAGPELEDRIQLYYVPAQREEKGVKIAVQDPAAGGDARFTRFLPLPGYGLRRACQPLPSGPGLPPQPDPACAASRSLAEQIALFQAVPLADEAGGRIRLYFEAQGHDGRTRILFLDSQDGYVGRDFHPGSPTVCATLADFSPGGPCEPQLAIGVDADGERGSPLIRHARQFKIGYPTLDSWLWDRSPGTFMWFTTEWGDRRCSAFPFNAAYAVWDGARWQVQDRGDGCPHLLEGAQAPFPVHLGGGRYKLYFNRHSTGQQAGGPFRKPLHILYADAAHAADPERVEFEDWEQLADARRVRFLWPDGGLLEEAEESLLDDFAIFAPAGGARLLVMLTNLPGGPQGIPFIGAAWLVNP